MNDTNLPEGIENRIYLIRNQKDLLDSDLAGLYGVATKVLVQSVQRNQNRFPEDFCFQLSNQEVVTLRSQIVTSKKGRGGRRTNPYAFTEQGVAMLSSVLRSEQAVQANIEIMRAFVRLRKLLLSHQELSQKLIKLEQKYDSQFKTVFEAIRQIMEPEVPPTKRQIGFVKAETER